jgi:hypothetical protein
VIFLEFTKNYQGQLTDDIGWIRLNTTGRLSLYIFVYSLFVPYLSLLVCHLGGMAALRTGNLQHAFSVAPLFLHANATRTGAKVNLRFIHSQTTFADLDLLGLICYICTGSIMFLSPVN